MLHRVPFASSTPPANPPPRQQTVQTTVVPSGDLLRQHKLPLLDLQHRVVSQAWNRCSRVSGLSTAEMSRVSLANARPTSVLGLKVVTAGPPARHLRGCVLTSATSNTDEEEDPLLSTLLWGFTR